jgi:hypothetical protein
MGFQDDLSVWPMALEAECLVRGQDGGSRLSVIKDARPFGQDNLSIEQSGGEEDKKFLKENKRQDSDDKSSKKQNNYLNSQDNTERRLILENCLSEVSGSLSEGPYFEPFGWRLIETGLWRAETEARYGPRLGPREIVLIRVSPDHFRLSPYHESEKEGWREEPGNIGVWSKRLPEAPFIINGGQYYPDRRYMGTLRRQGKDIGGGGPHKTFRGFWVQDPVADGVERPDSSLIDLETIRVGEPGQDDYGTVIQSYMVLDRLGRVRVRKTERLASRTVLGYDHEGRAVFIMVKGAIAMSDLAILAQKLGLASALGLDGGLETQLVFNTANGAEIQVGRYANNFLGNFLVEDLSPSLPSVIAFERLVVPLAHKGSSTGE